MSIHEVTISLGVIVGSGAGGYLSRNFGIHSPYWFAVVVLALGLMAQVIIWFCIDGAENKGKMVDLHRENRANSE